MKNITLLVFALVLLAGLGACDTDRKTMASHGTQPKETTVKSTITCGRQLAQHADISGSTFEDVNLSKAKFAKANLSGTDFDDINLSGARLHNINLSDLKVSAAQIGGSTFCCIGPPPDKDGKQARQRPVTFENAMLCDSTFKKVDLSGVKVVDCNLEGMTIDGVSVTEMMAAYKRQKR